MEPKSSGFKVTLSINIAAIITAVVSLVGMFLLRGDQQETNKTTDLVQESAFNVLKTEIDFNVKHLADIEAHIKDLQNDVSILKDKVKLVRAAHAECNVDNECQPGFQCLSNRCSPAPKLSLPEAPKIDKFDEIKSYVQQKKESVKPVRAE